jgi:hypothetical protein
MAWILIALSVAYPRIARHHFSTKALPKASLEIGVPVH